LVLTNSVKSFIDRDLDSNKAFLPSSLILTAITSGIELIPYLALFPPSFLISYDLNSTSFNNSASFDTLSHIGLNSTQ